MKSIYNLSTGIVTGTVDTNGPMDCYLVDEDGTTVINGWIEGYYAPDKWRIVDGVAQRYTVPINTLLWIREKRDVRLKMSDWTQVPDSPLTTEKKAEWATYRQALRDLPSSYTSSTPIPDVVWPTEPS